MRGPVALFSQPIQKLAYFLVPHVVAWTNDPLGHDPNGRRIGHRTDELSATQFALHHHSAFKRNAHSVYGGVNGRMAAIEKNATPPLGRLNFVSWNQRVHCAWDFTE